MLIETGLFCVEHTLGNETTAPRFKVANNHFNLLLCGKNVRKLEM